MSGLLQFAIAGIGLPRGMMTSENIQPAYLSLHRSGELKKRGEQLWQEMASCQLCPRNCKVNRLEGETGICKASSRLKIASFHPHFGEEKPLVGEYGSGTIFFSHCSLRCVFCINADISHKGQGAVCSIEQLSENMLSLQNMGCHNINLVTPTHYLPHILLALNIAADQGLRLPVVYNTHGWERLEILNILNGVVDIYLPDFKYWESKYASKYSAGAGSYPEITRKAFLEMHRQAGIAKSNRNGIMERGLMIRHLVMPNDVSGSLQILNWIVENLPKNTYINLMSQYRPVYRAFDYPEIARSIQDNEYRKVVEHARSLGLSNLDIQGYPF